MITQPIFTLQSKPLDTFEEYTSLAKVPVAKNVSNEIKAVEVLVNSLSALLSIERIILNEFGDANEEKSNSVMSDFITEQEKTIWMMNAWLGK